MNDISFEISAGEKQPWLAVCLSWILPGAGHVYAGYPATGVAVFVALVLCWVSVSWLVASCWAHSFTVGAAVLLILLIGEILVCVDVYRKSKKCNSPEFEQDRKAAKDPWLGLFLSLFFPGLGHAYLRRWVWLFIHALVYMVLQSMCGYLLNGVLAIAVSTLYSAIVMVHAFACGRSNRAISLGPPVKVAAGDICLVVALFVLAITVKTYLFEAFRIPANSMAPTITAGDRVVVNKTFYWTYRPQPGDLVAFSGKATGNEIYLKRIAGVEGETVEFRRGVLFVDGHERPLCGTKCDLPEDKVIFGGTEPYLVPKGSVFVLGDNRNRSYDSRMFGPVPNADIAGRVAKIYWPLNHVQVFSRGH